MTTAYIIRELDGCRATLVEPRAAAEPWDATEIRIHYTAHRGLLCRTWNASNGQGDQHAEVSSGLRGTGATIPLTADADIAKIVQREAFRRLGYMPPIREG